MKDPHVVALLYQIEHSHTVDYSEAQSLSHEDDLFLIRIEDKRVRFEMKDHFATEAEAREAVEPYIRAWEFDVALDVRPGRFRLRFDRSERIDRSPTPGVFSADARQIDFSMSLEKASAVASRPYPIPPSGVTVDPDNPDVSTLFRRYEGYCNGEEPLPSVAYFCFTMLTKYMSAGPEDASRKYGISQRVLRTVSMLSSLKGGPSSARKNTGVCDALTPQEVRFLEEAVKVMVLRAAEVACNPIKHYPHITREDLPTLLS